MILDIGVGDDTRITRGQDLPTLDRSKATLIIHRTLVVNNWLPRSSVEAVLKEYGIRTEEPRGYHHIRRRDIEVNSIHLQRLLHLRIPDVGEVHIVPQVCVAIEFDILIGDIIRVSKAKLPCRLIEYHGLLSDVPKLNMGLCIDFTVHIVGLTSLESKVRTHDRHQIEVRASDSLTSLSSTHSIDMRRSIASSDLRILRLGVLGVLHVGTWAIRRTIIIAEARTRHSTRGRIPYDECLR